MSIGTLPNVNSIKTNRDVKAGEKCLFPHPPECQFWLETSVCFRITRLMNNQIKSQKKSDQSPKRRESDDKNAVAIVKSVSQLGCVFQDSDALVSPGRESRRNPMQKVLEPIQRVRFTKSTIRQASIPEKKGTIAWKNTGQKSSSAKSLRYEI